MSEQFFIRSSPRAPWQEASEEAARDFFLSSCSYVGLKDDRFHDRGICFARMTGAKTRVVVNFDHGEELDPTPDMSYDFHVQHNLWDPVIQAVREEMETTPHRPVREQRGPTLSAQELVEAAIRPMGS